MGNINCMERNKIKRLVLYYIDIVLIDDKMFANFYDRVPGEKIIQKGIHIKRIDLSNGNIEISNLYEIRMGSEINWSKVYTRKSDTPGINTLCYLDNI
jgi:hypothetical protein